MRAQTRETKFERHQKIVELEILLQNYIHLKQLVFERQEIWLVIGQIHGTGQSEPFPAACQIAEDSDLCTPFQSSIIQTVSVIMYACLYP